MKKTIDVEISKSDALKALRNVLDKAMLNDHQSVMDISVIELFIEQEYGWTFDDSNEKAEGTI